MAGKQKQINRSLTNYEAEPTATTSRIYTLKWGLTAWLLAYPTDLFTTFKLQNPSHDAPELNKFCQSPDLNAQKNCKTTGRVYISKRVKDRRLTHFMYFRNVDQRIYFKTLQLWSGQSGVFLFCLLAVLLASSVHLSLKWNSFFLCKNSCLSRTKKDTPDIKGARKYFWFKLRHSKHLTSPILTWLLF